MTIEKPTVEARQARGNTNLRYILLGSLIAIAVAGWVLMSIN